MNWAKEEDKKLEELYLANYKRKEIAKKLNISDNSVKYRLKKLNIPQRPKTASYRRNLPKKLNDIEEQVIYGSLLGDGAINLQKQNRYNFRECHSTKQINYLKWKAKLLKRWNSKIYEINNYNRVELYTPYHSIWKNIRKEIYKNNKKIITKKWLDKIDYLGLMIWIGDDGTRHGSGCRISACALTEEEIDLVTEIFSKKFNIPFRKRYRKSVDNYYIAIFADDYKDLVKNFKNIPPDIKYKFNFK
jgi:hypothetical protein